MDYTARIKRIFAKTKERTGSENDIAAQRIRTAPIGTDDFRLAQDMEFAKRGRTASVREWMDRLEEVLRSRFARPVEEMTPGHFLRLIAMDFPSPRSPLDKLGFRVYTPTVKRHLAFIIVLTFLGASAHQAFAQGPVPSYPGAADSALQPTLESLGLTAAIVEIAGYSDTPQGLLEIKTGKLYVGPARKEMLEKIKKGLDINSAAPDAMPAQLSPAFYVKLKKQNLDKLIAAGPASHSQYYDQAAPSGGVVVDEFMAVEASLHTPTDYTPTDIYKPRPRPKAIGMPPLEPSDPAVTVGMAGRGNLARMVSLARGALAALPGKGVKDLAESLALRAVGAKGAPEKDSGVGKLCDTATRACLNRLLGAYYGRQPEVGPEWDWIKDSVADGFRAGMGKDARIQVVVSGDLKLIKNRGLWVANPVLPHADGSWTMVVNDRWLGNVVLKRDRLLTVLEGLDDRDRNRLIETALQGKNPRALGGQLPYLLAGWTQAQTLEHVKLAMAAGASPERAQEEAEAALLRDPVRREVLAATTESMASIMQLDKKHGNGAPEAPPKTSPVLALTTEEWEWVKAANAGDSDALDAVLSLAVYNSDSLDYLNLEDPQIQGRVEAELPKLLERGDFNSLLRRLAAQGSRQAIAHVSRFQEDAPFMEKLLSAASADPALRSDYKSMLADMQGAVTRSFPETLARQVTLWRKLVLSGPISPNWLSIFEEAPPEVQRKLVRVLAASQRTEDIRRLRELERAKPWARTARQALTATDIETERVMQRASVVQADSKTLRASAQEVEVRHKAYPQMFLGLMKEDSVVAPLLEVSRRTGIDPYYLAAAAFQEGYIQHAFKAESGGKSNFTSVGPMGIDSFPDYLGVMRKRSFLRADYKAFTIEKVTWKNEAGHELKEVRFDGPASALEAMVGMLRFKEAQFLRDAKALGISAESIPQAEREIWTYVYYNFTNPKAQLEKYGVGWVWRDAGMGQDVHNAQRVGATAAFLRKHKIFALGAAHSG